MNSDTTNGTRGQPRVFIPGPVETEIAEEPTLTANAYDVSEGGICLLFPQMMQLGDILIFNLDQPDGTNRRFEAVVRYVETAPGGCRAGLQWRDLKPGDQRAIKQLVDQLVEDGAEIVAEPRVEWDS